VKAILRDVVSRVPRVRALLDSRFGKIDRIELDVIERALHQLATQDPSLDVAYRAMGGKHRSFHDRFLVIDDSVYLLGNSVARLGTRPTTIFRAPDPRGMIADITAWWKNSISLEEVGAIQEKDSSPDDDDTE
jgi:hypothetical protein